MRSRRDVISRTQIARAEREVRGMVHLGHISATSRLFFGVPVVALGLEQRHPGHISAISRLFLGVPVVALGIEQRDGLGRAPPWHVDAQPGRPLTFLIINT